MLVTMLKLVKTTQGLLVVLIPLCLFVPLLTPFLLVLVPLMFASLGAEFLFGRTEKQAPEPSRASVGAETISHCSQCGSAISADLIQVKDEDGNIRSARYCNRCRLVWTVGG